MSRGVRKVPEHWQHPKNDGGRFKALHDANFDDAAADWDKGQRDWSAGIHPDYADEENKLLSYSEWAGDRPKRDDYMPSWTDAEKTHLMMYETTTEGTPISPAFKTPDELARWLFENNASAFGRSTASYEAWLRVAKGGYAVSAVYTPATGLISGVEALGEQA